MLKHLILQILLLNLYLCDFKYLMAQTNTNPTFKKYPLVSKGMKLSSLEGNEGKRYAILVGVNSYQDVGLSKLNKSINDARAFEKILQQYGQFDSIFVLADDVNPRGDSEFRFPTRENILRKIDSLLMNINSDDMLVFFFSGHGVSDYEEKAYILPIDTDTNNLYKTSLNVDEIVSKFQNRNLKKFILVLDACRDTLYSSKNASRNSMKERNFDESQVAVSFYSTRSGFFSYEDDESDYGVFTKFMIYGLEGRGDLNSDGIVTFSELENYVTESLRIWSMKKNKNQKPFVKIHGEKSGDLAITFAKNPKKSLIDLPVPKPLGGIDFAMRSIVLPGWGQWTNRRNYAGSLYFSLGMTSLAYYSYQMRSYKKSMEEYNSFLPLPSLPEFGETYLLNALVFRDKRSKVDMDYRQTQQAFAGVMGIFLVNVLDAYFFSETDYSLVIESNVSPYHLENTYAYEQTSKIGIEYHF